MKLGQVVEASAQMAATRSRKLKTTALVDLLGAASKDELPIVVTWLSGEVPQGKLGVGWRSLASLDVDGTEEPRLDVVDVDDAFEQLAAARGTGSAALRSSVLTELFTSSTPPEQDFLKRLLTGELRQGSLAGLMVDAVAQATGQPVDSVRRAHMLTGSLSETAVLAAHGGDEALRGVRLQVGRAIAPMLATPADDLPSALADLGPDVVVDFKLDGARIQVHRNGGDVRVFTRTLRDVTDRVPDLVEVVLGFCLLYTSPSPRDGLLSRMPSSA